MSVVAFKQRTGDRNANDAVSGRVTDCGNTPVCDPTPAGGVRNIRLLRRHGDLRTFLETGAVRSVEAANSGAEPRRAVSAFEERAETSGDFQRTRLAPSGMTGQQIVPSAEMPTAPLPIWLDAEPLSRNVVGEAVGEFVTGVFIVAILCPVIWAFCLLIRYLGARFHL